MRWRRDPSWNPRDLSWRVAVLFMVGSFLFALGSFPPYSGLVDGRVVGVTFVVGSVMFTTAGSSQFLLVINNGRAELGRPMRLWSRHPGNAVWWATFVQLIGTMLFNASTIDAMVETFTVEETDRLVWGPDVFGSIAFLVASHLAWTSTCGRLWCVHRDDAEWWSDLLNYVGSIAFMASAIASFTLTTTGQALNTTIVNSGTFLGAVCFLVGAYLLLPPFRPGRGAAATSG